MFEVLRLVLDLWVIAGLLAVVWFLHREFDRRNSTDWFGAAMSAPVIGWSFWLAACDLKAAFAVTLLPGVAWLRMAAFGG